MTDATDRRPGLPAADLHERIREVTFALLLTKHRAIAPDEIAAATGAPGHGLPAILDVPVGKGRVLLFAFNPMHRYLNHGDFRWVYNAILNWNDLPKE